MNEKSILIPTPAKRQVAAGCFHGGAFFDAIGPDFQALERRHEVINADVLDAWFPPAPPVLSALEEHLPWLLRTSPPIWSEGLVEAIASARGLEPECILAGPGSSALIYLALSHWLDGSSRVLLLDPTYGEYAHVLEQVVCCRVDRFQLNRGEGYHFDLDRAEAALADGYDLVVLVNPNNPTGQLIPGHLLRDLLARIEPATRVWIDEAYMDYAGAEHSLERFAVETPNVMVCKSLSKVLALSGARVAYLCGSEKVIRDLRRLAPPWWVSLTAQVAAVAALGAGEYYLARYRETELLREELMLALRCLMDEVVPGVANFLLCQLPAQGRSAAEVIRCCRKRKLFLRDVSTMGTEFDSHAIRIAVKDRETNQRMVEILDSVFLL